MRWLRRHWFGLGVVGLAHALPYFWIMGTLVRLEHTHPVAVWLNTLLNALLAPCLLLLLIHVIGGLRRSLLARLYILAHHLLLAAVFLLFLLHSKYFGTLPNLFLVHAIGNLPFILPQLVFQLMGYQEWLTLALLGASCWVALRWSGRTARTYPLVAGVLAAVVLASFTVKEVAIQRVMEPHGIRAPVTRRFFKIHGFIPLLAERLDDYRNRRDPGEIPWPGKLSAVSASGAAAASNAAAGTEFAADAGAGGARPDLKNILIVQVESLDKWIIEHQVDGQWIMSNLRELKERSLYFENFFTVKAGGGSSDAELVALTGLLPQRYYGFRSINIHLVPSLARILSEHGYRSVGMHANEGRMYRRSHGYHALGFDRFIDQTAYTGNSVGWLSKDLEFFRQSLPRIMELPEPFFAYLITLQSHGPFMNFSEDTLKSAPSLNTGAFRHYISEDNYIKTMHEVDQALGFLLQTLRHSGLMERTIVLLYADHPSYIREQGCLHRDCIPFLIHAPGLPPGVDGNPASPLDIAPTLLALLGIPEPPRTFLGTSLLGSLGAEGSFIERSVLFRDGASIRRDPATGELTLSYDPADQKYLQYSDAVFVSRMVY